MTKGFPTPRPSSFSIVEKAFSSFLVSHFQKFPEKCAQKLSNLFCTLGESKREVLILLKARMFVDFY
jgi:hypothetical protein